MPNGAVAFVRMTKLEKAALVLLAKHFHSSENGVIRLLIREAAAGLQGANIEQREPMNSQETGGLKGIPYDLTC